MRAGEEQWEERLAQQDVQQVRQFQSCIDAQRSRLLRGFVGTAPCGTCKQHQVPLLGHTAMTECASADGVYGQLWPSVNSCRSISCES